jgi:serine/threonine protein kinase
MTSSALFIPLTHNKEGHYINSTYLLHKPLGSGASGTVYLATHLISNNTVAVKVIGKPSHDPSHLIESALSPMYATPIPVSSIQDNTVDPYFHHPLLTACPQLYNEVYLHAQVHDHPNVLSIIEVLDGCEYLFIVLEYCNQGDLFSALIEKEWYIGDEDIAKHLFLQLLDAVEYCHNRSIFHCDLKPENVLVSNDGQLLKVADFGLASSLPIGYHFGRGSKYYMAPENIAENKIYWQTERHSLSNKDDEANLPIMDSKSQRPVIAEEAPGNNSSKGALLSKGYPRGASDVWSLGVILLNIIFGRNPWKKASLVEDIVYRGYLLDPRRLEYVLPVSSELNAILARVFHSDPYRRIKIAELRKGIVACKHLTRVNKFDFPWFTPRKSSIQLCQPKTMPNLKRPVIQNIQKASVEYVHSLGLTNVSSGNFINMSSFDFSSTLSTGEIPAMTTITNIPKNTVQVKYLCGMVTPATSPAVKTTPVVAITSYSLSLSSASEAGVYYYDSVPSSTKPTNKPQKQEITSKILVVSNISATSIVASTTPKPKFRFGRKFLDKISHHRRRIRPCANFHEFLTDSPRSFLTNSRLKKHGK